MAGTAAVQTFRAKVLLDFVLDSTGGKKVHDAESL